MLIQRVSNAGVLLQLDGVKLLLDGFCKSVGPYVETPAHIRTALMAAPADVVAFTHGHDDHFHETLAAQYHKQTLRPILGPENLPCGAVQRGIAIGTVSIQPVKSRHIGKEYAHIPHMSYVIRGSKTVWFLGDAAPSQWREVGERADVMIVPFAYGLSDSAWRMTCSLADKVVLVHTPLRENDPDGLWPQVEAVTKRHCRSKLIILDLGQTIELP